MPDPLKTRASLIQRLPDPSDVVAWEEFLNLYSPLVYRIARRQALHTAELTEMSGKLEAAKQTIELRNRIQDQIVERRISDLLNPDFEWPASP